jgi:hypothetical protein
LLGYSGEGHRQHPAKGANADVQWWKARGQAWTGRICDRPTKKVELERIPRVIDEDVQESTEGKQKCADAKITGRHSEIDACTGEAIHPLEGGNAGRRSHVHDLERPVRRKPRIDDLVKVVEPMWICSLVRTVLQSDRGKECFLSRGTRLGVERRWREKELLGRGDRHRRTLLNVRSVPEAALGDRHGDDLCNANARSGSTSLCLAVAHRRGVDRAVTEWHFLTRKRCRTTLCDATVFRHSMVFVALPYSRYCCSTALFACKARGEWLAVGAGWASTCSLSFPVS